METVKKNKVGLYWVVTDDEESVWNSQGGERLGCVYNHSQLRRILILNTPKKLQNKLRITFWSNFWSDFFYRVGFKVTLLFLFYQHYFTFFFSSTRVCRNKTLCGTCLENLKPTPPYLIALIELINNSNNKWSVTSVLK